MRRKISLYIADRLVDLDDQSFILFNYTMDDLSNPTIVKNSFSQQITLKGTPANNKIFGGYFKVDRRLSYTGSQAGVDFNASQKTPFKIFNEMGEILESGYVKLDSVTRKGADIEYKITLYGGLGSFFYALSYDANGNKRTLADLDYLGTGNSEAELNFTINADAVEDAWARLFGDTSVSAIWDIINFAPAYNGIPDGNFSPDKALVVPSDVGLQDTIGNYTLKSNYALVNLAEAQDEWAVKDLRSYLQRPVFSMKAFWDAICNPDNNGGYEVDADIIQDTDTFGAYANLWLTLPLISSIGTIHQSTGSLTLSMSSTASSGNTIGRYDIQETVSSGTRVTANLYCKIRFNMPSGANSYNSLAETVGRRAGLTIESKYSVMFLQAVAYGSDDSVVGGSNIKVIGSGGNGADTAAACGYVPTWIADYENFSIQDNEFTKVSSGVFEIPNQVGFTVEALDVAYYKIMVSVYSCISRTSSSTSGGGTTTTKTYSGDGTTSTPTMYVNYTTSFTANTAFIVQGGSSNSVSYTSSDHLRSGAVITKRMLLSTSHTPAEYLISFCKVFGLYLDYDVTTRKVTILRRNDLYQDETIDLTQRVDTTHGISVLPLVFNSKWYDLNLEGVGGAFYDEYLNVEGVEYGIQRVNTGYDFNADAVNLMDSVVFKNACTILARSKYFNYIFNGQVFIPSPFVDKGNTYTLWSSAGDTLETDISCPPNSATVTYYDDEKTEFNGYDIHTARKLELRSADGKPLDGTDILVFCEGRDRYSYFKISDDVPAMDVLNDGVPCWLLAPGETGTNAPWVPSFQRYKYGHIAHIEDSLDFGVPRQLDIPGIANYDPTCTIYARAWQAYLSDRYDVNSKVMTCRVNFAGMKVNQELLRKFYWYDNALWVLNKITNYSLTTYDPVECEFVQVQDKDNYLNGQIFD